MVSRLLALSGPSRDRSFPLAGEVSIGREASNEISLADPMVSRRHCRLSRETGGWRLSDQGSLNGTFVGGEPVTDRLLAHGDRIAIGETVLLFLDREEAQAPEDPLLEEAVASGRTVRLSREDALGCEPEPSPAERDLRVLLRIADAIHAIRDPEELQRKILESVFEIVPAERGAILVTGDDPAEILPVAMRDRTAGPDVAFPWSRSVVRGVLREGVSVLCRDIRERPEWRAAESLRSGTLGSLLCVPMGPPGDARGVLYLDLPEAAPPFTEGHLRLLTVVAGIASSALESARRLTRLRDENERLREDLRIEHSMVGDSPRMQEVYAFIGRVARADSTVLIRGESGTGKELAAEAIHRSSPRASRPFVPVNCAALTEALLESELFGHELGAFTGAVAGKKGKLEVANGGTVFLDEVGELAPPLQAKLLRALQERVIERVGGTRPIRVDIRVLAATNRDIEEAVRAGAFRKDLYFRLNVLSLTMPPLRERREDIPLLASHFAARVSQKLGRPPTRFTPEARDALLRHDWPGNVRELANAIERAVVLGTGSEIRREDLPEPILEGAPSPGSFHDAVAEAKRGIILRAFEEAGGSHAEAARILDLHPNYLHRLVRNLGLRDTLKK